MNLSAGKFYARRDGKFAGPMEYATDDGTPYFYCDHPTTPRFVVETYTPDGFVRPDRQPERGDLVHEWRPVLMLS